MYVINERLTLTRTRGEVVCGGGGLARVAHERLVSAESFLGVLTLPTSAAEVLEARHFAANARTLAQAARGAQGILKVRIDLDLKEQRTF